MPRTAEPEARDFLRARRIAEATDAAEKATARLLAGIEADGARAISPARTEALRRHGNTLHRIGGRSLVQQAFSRLCAVPPQRASRRFDLLGRAWGELLSEGGQPCPR